METSTEIEVKESPVHCVVIYPALSNSRNTLRKLEEETRFLNSEFSLFLSTASHKIRAGSLPDSLALQMLLSKISALLDNLRNSNFKPPIVNTLALYHKLFLSAREFFKISPTLRFYFIGV